MARPKKTAPKKAITRKATAQRTPKMATPKERAGIISMLKNSATTSRSAGTRRPPNNPDIPQTLIDMLNHDLNAIKEMLDTFAQHLRALDRMRLNGVGIKKLGFIERAYELALENTEFLPHYLTIERFGADLQYFMDFRSLTDVTAQLREQFWNITIKSADIAYTDALEFYSSVREAAKRRVDAAETLYAALSPFFKRHRMENEDGTAAPTKKQALRDFKGLESGKHDGILVIENQKPQMTGGKRKIIDEKFSDSAKFKESEEGKIEE